MKKIIILVSVFLLCFAPAYATNYVSDISGNWNNPLIWTPNGIPGTWDTATIGDGDTVTITGTETIFTCTIQTGGTLNMSAGSTLNFQDTPGSGFGDIYGDVYLNGEESNWVTIKSENADPTNHWDLIQNNGATFDAQYTIIDEVDGGWTTLKFEGKVIMNYVNITGPIDSYVYFNNPDPGGYIRNIYVDSDTEASIYFYRVGNENLGNPENITTTGHVFLRYISPIIFKNFKIAYLSHYQQEANNLIIKDSEFTHGSRGLFLASSGNFVDGILFVNDTKANFVEFFRDKIEPGKYYEINLINTIWDDTIFDNQYMTNLTYLVSKDHNGVPNDWRYWGGHYNGDISLIKLRDIEYKFGEDDNVRIMQDRLIIDEDAQMDTLNVTENATYEVIDGSTTEGDQVIDMSGDIIITDGNFNNFVIKDMGNTKADFYNAIDIQLQPWSTLPASGASGDIIGRAVNVSGLTANSAMDLNIYYSDADVSGMDENDLRIFRYNGSEWILAPGGVDTANNYVWANNIEDFSLFAIGESNVPEITDVVITPDPAYTDNDLTCTVTASDPNDDPLTYYYTWSNGSTNIASGPISSNTYVLPSVNTEQSDQWTCYASVSDGALSTTTKNDETVIVNNLPTITNVDITPATVYTADDLTCSVIATDADVNDILTYSFNWSNGINSILSGPILNNTHILTSVNTVQEETWTCSVEVSDTFDLVTSSTNITILLTPIEEPNNLPSSRGSGSHTADPTVEYVPLKKPVVTVVEGILEEPEETVSEELPQEAKEEPTIGEVGVGSATGLFNRVEENLAVIATIIIISLGALLFILRKRIIKSMRHKKEK